MLLCVQQYDVSLACGLFAFIGPDPAYFSWDKFNILGWFNDKRGGDACGRIVGNNVQHGVDLLKTYKEFCIDVPPPVSEDADDYRVVLGHCRKASSGGKDDIYAQPIVLRRKDINMKSIKDTHLKSMIKQLEDDDIVFSGIHNGTIDNYRELAPAYGIPTEDHNDSKVLLTALFYNNIDVLSRYVGTAAIIWHNHVYNKTYVFKGASKMYAASIVEKEEKPLYFWTTKGGVYFSSEEDSLKIISLGQGEVVDMATNMLYTYKNGELVKELKIDRSKVSQEKESITKYSETSRYPRHNYDRVDGFYECDVIEAGNMKQLDLPWKTERNPFVRCFSCSEEPFRIQSEVNELYHLNRAKSAIYNKSRYWMNGGLMHGVYPLSTTGLIPIPQTRDFAALKLYYFVEGVMMDGYPSFIKAIEEHGKMMKRAQNNIADLPDLEDRFIKEIVKYSKYPTAALLSTSGIQEMYASSNVKYTTDGYYDGCYQPLFSRRRYYFVRGSLSNIVIDRFGSSAGTHDETDRCRALEHISKCSSKILISDIWYAGYRLYQNDTYTNPMSPFQKLILFMNDLSESIEMQLFLVHYIRDFRDDMSLDHCIKCPNEDTTILEVCTKCSHMLYEGYELQEDVSRDELKVY